VNPVEFLPAIFAALGFVMVVPAWVFWSGSASSATSLPTSWLVAALLPLGLLLLIVSWVD